MTPEELAAAIIKLPGDDRVKVKRILDDKDDICSQCWQDGDGWCCYESRPEY